VYPSETGLMPHLKCVTCKTRLHIRDGPGHRHDELCPNCGSALEPAGDLAELVGFRAITSEERDRRDGERWLDDGGSAAAVAVALPRPEPTC
jgi:hypothetical protein